MAKPRVSNKNARLTAILKVVMLYLGTFLLLSFIFRNKTKVTETPVVEEVKTYETEMDILKDMYQKIDSLAKITEQLIDLDKEDLQKEGAKASEIAQLEASFNSIKSDLFLIEHTEYTSKEEQYVEKTLFQLLNDYRADIKELEETKIILEGDSAEKIEEIEDMLKEKYEKEIEAKEKEIKTLDKQLDKSEKKGDNSSASSKELEDELADLKGKVATIQAKVDALQASIRNIDPSIFKSGQRDKIDHLEDDIDNLKNYLDGIQ